jgi:hypothetical protein
MVFENFYHDMGDPPAGLSLDRIDNNRGYSKSNCRWATRKEQGNNTRANHRVVIDGQEMTIMQAAEKYSICHDTLRYRIKNGMSPERAVREPVRLQFSPIARRMVKMEAGGVRKL